MGDAAKTIGMLVYVTAYSSLARCSLALLNIVKFCCTIYIFYK